MKMIIFYILFIFAALSSAELHAQMNGDFHTFIDHIPPPPASCEEAMNFFNNDSTVSGLTSVQRIDTLENFFDKIYSELSLKSEKVKKIISEREEERKGNPDGRFRGEMQAPPEMRELIEDMHNSDEILNRVKQAEEKFKSEAAEKQKRVNTEIKKAEPNDIDAKRTIIGDFLKDINELYSGFAAKLKQDFKQLDEISRKYKYDSEENKPVFRKRILEMHLSEAENLILLLSCVKGSAEIGAKFYKK